MANTYTREEAHAETLRYFNGDELATSITVDKYLLSDDETYYESNPDQKHRRLAREFARVENKYLNPLSEDEIYYLLKDYRYVIPQGSPMAGIGNPFQTMSLSNCFTIGSNLYDSYSGILHTDQEIVQIEKRRGGVGTDVSNILKEYEVKNAAKTTDGIEIFMQRFSNSTREVAQNGRRGALMLTCSCHHPEILTFIRSKKNLEKITGANISVRWTDEFMNAVKNDTEVQLRWPVDSTEPKISVCKSKRV
jgi:ribonucleoside-diphosphate reductase alpha chain